MSNFLEGIETPDWKFTRLSNSVRYFRKGWVDSYHVKKENLGLKTINKIKHFDFSKIEALKAQIEKDKKKMVLAALFVLFVLFICYKIFTFLLILYGIIAVGLTGYSSSDQLIKVKEIITGEYQNRLDKKKGIQKIEIMGKVVVKESQENVNKFLQDLKKISNWHSTLSEISPDQTEDGFVEFRAKDHIMSQEKSSVKRFSVNGYGKLIKVSDFGCLLLVTKGKIDSKSQFNTNQVLICDNYPKHQRRSVLTYYINAITTGGIITDIDKLWEEGEHRISSLVMLKDAIEDRFVNGMDDFIEHQFKQSQQDKIDPELIFTKQTIHSKRLINDINRYKSYYLEAVRLFEMVLNFDYNEEGDFVKRNKISFNKKHPGYSILNNGQIECYDVAQLKMQDRAYSNLLSQTVKASSSKSKALVECSLPIVIMDCEQTMLERMVGLWDYLPLYLRKAGAINPGNDTALKRFKLVTAFGVTGLANIIQQKKPFNPVLGETYQGFWPDGTTIDIENTNTNPPTVNYLITDPFKQFKLWGCYKFDIK